MKNIKFAYFVLLFFLGFGSMYLIDQGVNSSDIDTEALEVPNDGDDLPLIEWTMLQKFDHKTGKGPKELLALDGKVVKMPGFVVPLSDNYSELSEFLLVPNAQACIHVPPPPPNLIVTVKLRKSLPSDQTTNPAWIYGRFKIENTESEYGGSSYKIDGFKMEKYTY
jgi:hypothetical protein